MSRWVKEALKKYIEIIVINWDTNKWKELLVLRICLARKIHINRRMINQRSVLNFVHLKALLKKSKGEATILYKH